MHNCKQTRQNLVDLALAEQPVESQVLPELNSCSSCREELATLRSALHVSAQALRSTAPDGDFWDGYHGRLRSKIMAGAAPTVANQPGRLPFGARAWAVLIAMTTSSVRLPVPAALVAILIMGISFTVLLRGARASGKTPDKPALVETRTVEVPVVHEKVVTRVVYVEKRNGRSVFDGRTNSGATPNLPNSVATVGPVPSRKTALSLVGFKPTDQVQLTIIKGSHQDEK
jgi:hypothetical protein